MNVGGGPRYSPSRVRQRNSGWSTEAGAGTALGDTDVEAFGTRSQPSGAANDDDDALEEGKENEDSARRTLRHGRGRERR